jgi:fructokinase
MYLICGEALYDVFLEAETTTGLRLDARMGGSPFNVAIGLARLSRRVGLFTGMSTDSLGRHLEKTLTDEGVETAYLARKDGPTTLAYVDVGADGFARYTFYGHGAADRSVALDDLPQIPDGRVAIHFGSYSLVAEPTATSFHGLARREEGKRLISLDPNVRLNVEPDLDLWRKRVDAFAGLADLIKVSDEDLGQLYPGETFESVASRWRARGARLVVVTRGELGAAAFLREEVYQAPGRPVSVVDTVGAGDSFAAALLCGLDELGKATREGIDTLSLEECRRITDFAIEAAAITCSRRGADLPRRAELPGL